VINNYFMPTRVISGDGCIGAFASELKPFGKTAMLVTGATSAKKNGSLDDVTAALAKNGQTYFVYDKVKSNPTVPCVYEGAAEAKRGGADFIIAVGGGSPIDAAKVMALLACRDIPESELFSGNYGNCALPIIAVPTTAGTGSEVTPYSILTNDKAETKTSVATPLIFPKIAFLDAKYLMGLPRDTMVNTVIDALSHAIEGMLSVRAGVLSDSLASCAVKKIISACGDLEKGSLSKEQYADLLYASTLAGMVIANTGTTVVHAMGYSLTYYKEISHGRATGLLLGRYLEFVRGKAPALCDKVCAAAGIKDEKEIIKKLAVLLGKPEQLTGAEISHYSAKAAVSKNIQNGLIPISQSEIETIFKDSMTLSN
jgi:alcohol dehydrogenase class IV